MVKLGKIINVLKEKRIEGSLDIDIAGIAYNSRKVKNGFIFVCIKGFKADGHNYIDEALARGAAALVVERKVERRGRATFIEVPSSREALALLSNDFYGNPSTKLKLIGVTGTNGKTTVTYLTEAILKEAGYEVGLLGTVVYKIEGRSIPALTTTPESLDLQAMLAQLVVEGCSYVVMEVSSHAIELKRILGCEYDVAAFTNLTIDHLDFHKNMEDYLAAKTKLFSQLGKGGRKCFPKTAVVNTDDPFGQHILANTSAQVLTYGLKGSSDLRARDIKPSFTTISFRALTPEGEIDIDLKMPGLYNVYNALAAMSIALTQGIDLKVIKKGLEKAKAAPGRFELIDCGQNYKVIVDFAHTPDALEKVLSAIKDFVSGKIITVFGSGGERDRLKRPLMGEVVARLSDYMIVTSDNPGKEDPHEICKEIERGIKRVSSSNGRYAIIIDREEAIKEALKIAKEGDVILLAGKGHETYQLLKDGPIPFNDAEIVRSLLSKQRRINNEN